MKGDFDFASGLDYTVRVFDGVRYVVDAAGHVIRALDEFDEYLYKRSKRPRNTDAAGGGEVKTEKDVSYSKDKTLSKTMYKPCIDGHTIGVGAEVLMRGLTTRLAQRAYADNIREFFKRLNRRKKFSSQFCLQLFVNENDRHVQMHWFRHVKDTNKYPAVHNMLVPYSTNELDASGETTNPLSGLEVNGYGVYQDRGYGRSLWSPASMQDLEEMSYKLGTTISTWQGNDLSTSLPSLPFVDWNMIASHPARSALYFANNPVGNPSTTTWQQQLKAVLVDGGVKYLFENKHGSDAFVEIIVVKVKRGREKEISGSSDSDTANTALGQYAAALGSAWVRKQQGIAGTDNLLGKIPAADDVFSNPWYPLLPEDHRNAANLSVHMTQKKRFKFALPSGAKRNVNISFGGHVWDPASVTVNELETNGVGGVHGKYTVGVIIAVNGQIVSSLNTRDTNSAQIVSRDMYSSGNVLIMGEYYETVQACVQGPDASSKFYSRSEIDPRIVSSSGWTTEAMQIIPPSQIIRGPHESVNIGHTMNDTAGNSSNVTERI